MGFLDAIKTPVNNTTLKAPDYDGQIAALAQKKQELLFRIGQLYADGNDAATAAGTVYEEPLKGLREIEEELAGLEKKKLAKQGMRKCEKCGNALALDSAFCNKCGEKLEPLFAVAEQNAYVCPKCGAPYSEGALFCTQCGNKLGDY